MKIASKILLFLILCFSRVFSQGMYIPLEFQEAYENGTRSLDGKPGADYWQNHSDYRITAELDPVSGKLSGSAVITYFNSSPDTLDRLVFRLYQNIQKKDAMRDFIINSKDSSEGLVINALSIGKRTFSPSGDTSLEYTGTNLIVKNLSIMPGKQTTINVSWEFKIPGSEGIRMGRYDSTSFFIAYWYPQVAVYDDIDGWDMTEYTGNAEFYNDFNNYDVKITLPSDYCSWATGELQNPQDVLSANVLSRYSEAMSSSTTVNIITANDIVSAEPLFNNSAETNTWHYIAKGVTDFTFAAAASYLWDGRLADSGGKKVFVSAAYKESSLNYYEVCDISAKTIEIASRDLPGIIFPFPKITVFDGRGGMESPMMVNMGPGEQRIWTVH
ncbi:MAG TPA: hypothetical protein PKA39_09525, partial [Ignavibacteria bacterium]|nr:hypothetical protein [Ignavibacteria bacterium]